MRKFLVALLLSGAASAQMGVPGVTVSVGTGWNQQVQWGVSVGTGYPAGVYTQGYPVYTSYPSYQVPVYNVPVYTQTYPNYNYNYNYNAYPVGQPCAPRYVPACPTPRYTGWGRRSNCR